MNRLLTVAVLAVSLGATGIAQDSIEIRTDPNDPSRPLSTLLGRLRQREKIAVTYEDPRYSKRADMHGPSMAFTYSSKAMRGPDGVDVTIARMLREYGASGGLTFTVVRDGTRLHVVPSESVNTAGHRIRQDSILDTVITIPRGRRDGGELLQAICDEVRKRSGYEIAVGPSAPANNLARFYTADGIESQSARAALEQLLDKLALPNSFVWDLYYDPADKTYGLNFSYVGPAGPGHTAKWPD